MKNIFKKTALITALLMVTSASFASTNTCSQTGNLVANCGFGTGDFTGWTVTGNDVPGEEGNLYGVEQGADPVDGISPHSGSYQAFFADLTSNATTISQTLTTRTGGNYLITFYVAQDTPASGTGESANELDVTFGGRTLADLNNVAVEGYTEYSFLASATSNSTALSLTLGNGLGEFLLDDVSVTSVPEPSTVAAVGIGLLAMLFAVRKRQVGR